MAKATALSPDLMTIEVPPITHNSMAAKPKTTLSVRIAPLQIRIPAAELKAIKLAAVEADQTISEFMLACFHAYIKK